MSIAFIGLQILGICAVFFALALLLNGDGSREQKMMEYFLMGALIQNIGYLLELTAPTMEAAMVAVKVQHLGTMIIPVCYCYFIYIYCFEEAPLKALKLICFWSMGLGMRSLSYVQRSSPM